MGVLSEMYPAGNFIESTPLNMLVFLIFEVLVYVLGNIFMQKSIGVEKVSGEELDFNKRELETIGST